MRSRTIRREAVPRFALTSSVRSPSPIARPPSKLRGLKSPHFPSGFDAFEFPLQPIPLLDSLYLDLARRFEEQLHHRLASTGLAVVTPHDPSGERWSRSDRDSHGRERRRAELLYTCEIRVNGPGVARTQGRRLPMSCPKHEGRKAGSHLPFFADPVRVRLDRIEERGTLGSVPVRFPFRRSPSIW